MTDDLTIHPLSPLPLAILTDIAMVTVFLITVIGGDQDFNVNL